MTNYEITQIHAVENRQPLGVAQSIYSEPPKTKCVATPWSYEARETYQGDQSLIDGGLALLRRNIPAA
jgi:hypothetical protein